MLIKTSNNRVIKNASWIIGVKIIQAILVMIVSMLTARYLGPTNYGLISYAASVVAFVTPIMQLGLNGTLVQEIVERPDDEGNILCTSIIMTLVSSVACIISVAIFTFVANSGDKETIIICILYSLLLPMQAIGLHQYWFHAKLLSKYVSFASLVGYVVMSIYQIYLLITSKSIIWFAVSNTIDHMIIGIILVYLYFKLTKSHYKFSFILAKRLFSKSKYYIISNLTIVVFSQTDRIMLKFMLNDAMAGYYSAAVTCAGMTSFVFAAIIDSMRPIIFEYKKRGDELLYKKSIIRLYSIIIYLALSQSILMTVFAPLIVNVMYGSDYQHTISVLQILVWYTTFSYYGSAKNIWILAESRQQYLILINVFGAIANVLLNFFLIPLCGAKGAAIASLITQIFTNIIICSFIKLLKYNNYLLIRSLHPDNIKDIIITILNPIHFLAKK